MRKLQHRDGRVAQLAASEKRPDEIIETLYLATLSRFPTESETKLMQEAFADGASRREATEDVLWTLLNMKEFIYNH